MLVDHPPPETTRATRGQRVRLTAPTVGVQPGLSTFGVVAEGSVGICCGPSPFDDSRELDLIVFDDQDEPVKAVARPDEYEVVGP